MLNQITSDYLITLNKIEHLQKQTGHFELEFPQQAYTRTAQGELFFLKDFFLKKSSVNISKHNRFAPFPLHTHDFVELSYMLKGHSEQIVNNERVLLNQGDILLINSGCHHSIAPLGEEDILINLIFDLGKIDTTWFEKLESSQKFLFTFLLHPGEHQTSQYVIFFGQSNTDVLTVFDSLLNKYFTTEHFSTYLVHYYLTILLIELLSNTKFDVRGNTNMKNTQLFELFFQIDKHFNEISLDQLARQFHYNNNYLSGMIKRFTGKTLSEIINEKRVQRAAFLLENTDLRIEDILDDLHLKNKGFFYKIFKEHYQQTPIQYRKKKQTSS
ncbi:AraC family transcriptional regulator [Enterococcus sp. OL5]|uniref:AraC family transcriptional regulator n=1 Tax=Enterococcus sp. OL5 TaxID=2590214 RepID=UPI00167C379C|nr:AraC family transcriptional regulator [Enterococcus sp. OL5]